MGKLLRRFLQRWLIDTVAVLAASVMPGIHYEKWPDLFLAAFMLGIVNTFLRPILMLLALPLVFLTLGLFVFVINALMLLLVGQIVPGFQVHGIGSALGGALIITLVSLILETLTGSRKGRVEIRRSSNGRRRRGPPDGDGPVIDV
jgi:putative membrane protein